MTARTTQQQTDFGLILFLAKQKSKDGEYVAPEEVAMLIEMAAEDAPLPGWLSKLACGHLRGQIKRPRGRPRVKDEWQERLLPLAQRDYHRMLAILQKRAKRGKRVRVSRLDGPPHERALELVHQHYKRMGQFRSINRLRFRDLISS